MATPAYTAGTDVTLTVPIPTDTDGNTVTPTAISYSVTDAAGVAIVTGVSVTLPTPDPSATTLAVVIPAIDNTLIPVAVDPLTGSVPFKSIRDLRVVTVTVTWATGTLDNTQSYIINNASPLIRMVNSFITWPETILARYEMSNLDGWDAASDPERVAALGLAWKNMLSLRYRFPIGVASQSRIMDFYGSSVDNVFGRIFMVMADISFYNAADFAAWPQLFTQALTRAQMAEANNILLGDPIGDKRNAGVLSETTGESSMSFRKVPEVRMPVCPSALIQLRGYIQTSVLVARG